jgi:hypothetical protein
VLECFPRIVKHVTRPVHHLHRFIGRGVRHHSFHRPARTAVDWICRIVGGGIVGLSPGIPLSGGRGEQAGYPGTFPGVPGFPEEFAGYFPGTGGFPMDFGGFSGFPGTVSPVVGPSLGELGGSPIPFNGNLGAVVSSPSEVFNYPNISEAITQLGGLPETVSNIVISELHPINHVMPEPTSILLLLSSLAILSVTLIVRKRANKSNSFARNTIIENQV